MDYEATWRFSVDDYVVPPPKPQQILSNNLPPTTVYSIPVNNDGGVVWPSFTLNTVGDVPLVVQVDQIPPRSQSVIMVGPGLAPPGLSPIQAHCKEINYTSVGSPRAKKPKTNRERCELYRKRQKTKKEKDEEELRMLDAKNRALKAKETDIRNRVQRMKAALLRMGLGNYVY